MAVGGSLVHRERNLFSAARFSQDKAISLVKGQTAAQIRKGEC